MGKIFKSGFVAIIGRPNVGKSSLLNALIGHKLAITTPKAQTTRNLIKGIKTTERSQMVFLDTPGLNNRQLALDKYMQGQVKKSLVDVDVILLVVDPLKPFAAQNELFLPLLAATGKPVILVINKMDALKDKTHLVENIETLTRAFAFADVFFVSAKTERELDKLEMGIFKQLPIGPQYYDATAFSDLTPEFIAAEIIREKMLIFLQEEIPHVGAVTIESLTLEPGDAIAISAVIYVEKPSQKAVLIGKGGAMIKRIGTSARRELMQIFETKVHLELFVTISANWRNDRRKLAALGYKA